MQWLFLFGRQINQLSGDGFEIICQSEHIVRLSEAVRSFVPFLLRPDRSSDAEDSIQSIRLIRRSPRCLWSRFKDHAGSTSIKRNGDKINVRSERLWNICPESVRHFEIAAVRILLLNVAYIGPWRFGLYFGSFYHISHI